LFGFSNVQITLEIYYITEIITYGAIQFHFNGLVMGLAALTLPLFQPYAMLSSVQVAICVASFLESIDSEQSAY